MTTKIVFLVIIDKNPEPLTSAPALLNITYNLYKNANDNDSITLSDKLAHSNTKINMTESDTASVLSIYIRIDADNGNKINIAMKRNTEQLDNR